MKKSFLFTIVLTFLINSQIFSQSSSIWTIVGTNNNRATGYGDNVGRSVTTFGGATRNNNGFDGAATTSWGTTTYNYIGATTWENGSNIKGWSIEAKTTYFSSITVSYSQSSDDHNGTNIGPRDFKLQYSLDNINYTDVSGCSVSLGAGWDGVVTKTNVALPAECENKSAVYFRWIMTSSTGVNGKVITSVGESRLANIDVRGIAIQVPPSDITLSNNTISASSPIGTVVGTLTATDPNPSDTHTFSLTAGEGDTHNSSFTIVGNELRTNASISAGTYSARINANDGTNDYSESFTITVTAYSSISGGDQTYDWIARIVFNTIDNEHLASNGGYNDYTAQSTTLNKNETYSLSVTNGSGIDPTYPQYIKAWFDWNINGSFDDDGEEYIINSSITTNEPFSTNITVPNTATEGTTRLRIVLTGAVDPGVTIVPPNSGTFQYGEAEDYNVVIEAALPVELSNFTGKFDKNQVELNWKTQTEINNYGFNVERLAKSLNSAWETIGFVEGSGNSNSVKQYSFTDKSLLHNGTYIYRLKQIDADGQYDYSEEINIVFNRIPGSFSLSQNYPNPFNPTTKIDFALPERSSVQLEIFNIRGERVSTIKKGELEAGYHSINVNGSNLSSGIYFYSIIASTLEESKSFHKVLKMTIIK